MRKLIVFFKNTYCNIKKKKKKKRIIPSTKPKPKDQSEEEKIEEGIVDLTIDTNCLNDDNYLADDDNEPICMSCNREIDYKSDIFYISGFKYHLSCIK